jgi:hypothetical protein
VGVEVAPGDQTADFALDRTRLVAVVLLTIKSRTRAAWRALTNPP